MRLFYWYCVVIILSCTALAVGQELLEDVRAQVCKAWEKQQTLLGNIEVNAIMPLGEDRLEVSGAGTLEYAKEDGTGKYRQRIRFMLPPPFETEATLTAVFDGQDLYLINQLEAAQEVKKESGGLLRGVIPPGGCALFGALEEDLILKPITPTEETDKRLFTLEGLPAAGKKAPFARAIIEIARETGALHRLQLFDVKNEEIASVETKRLEFGAEVNLERFAKPSALQEAAEKEAAKHPETANTESVSDKNPEE